MAAKGILCPLRQGEIWDEEKELADEEDDEQ